MKEVKNKMNPQWESVNNLVEAPYGRILIMWNPQVFKVTTLSKSDQFINLQVQFLVNNWTMFLTMVYAKNQRGARSPLWDDIMAICRSCTGPWAVAEDFHCFANSSKKVGGAPVISRDTIELRDSMHQCDLQDIKASGSFFTWSNRNTNERRILSKLYRWLINKEWLDAFPNFEAQFGEPGLSDHSSCVVNWYDDIQRGPAPF